MTKMLAKTHKLTLGYSPYESSGGHIYPFDDIFEKKQNVKTEGLTGCDAVILWGGRDIWPGYYYEKGHPRNAAGWDVKPNERDEFEHDLVIACRAKKIPLIGVCRGAQMLCISAGGKLIQHVNNHNGPDHSMSIPHLFRGGLTLKTNSVHHQMMYPFDVLHEMLGWSQIASMYEGESAEDKVDMSGKCEPEIVFFPEIKGLAIQGHPEYMNAPHEFVEYCLEMIRDFIL
jgi:anthranilate/para-aminobenzoate synthase component II